jgi:hypothetical protein
MFTTQTCIKSIETSPLLPQHAKYMQNGHTMCVCVCVCVYITPTLTSKIQN